MMTNTMNWVQGGWARRMSGLHGGSVYQATSLLVSESIKI
jgi:hypothetical protein